MNKKDIIENLNGYKAVNAFIFAGSFSLGVMKAGFDLQKVLEISDTQLKDNAFYFKKNVEDVPVVLPNEWENDEYLSSLKSQNIDLMCCNCPCSSLSQINRNASVDGKNNVHFYRLFNIFEHVQPKVFVIENAPTLVKLGFPIIRDMAKKLSSLYNFTVIHDCAGHHEVPMMRMRTLVVGWRKDHFKNYIPVVKLDRHDDVTVGDTFKNIINDSTNDFRSLTVDDISDLYKYAVPGRSLITGLAKHYIEDGEDFVKMLEKRLDGTNHLREVKRIALKMKGGKNFWDKTPVKLSLDKRFPSLTSVNEYLHPTQDRALSLREVQRIMGYPDWYDFTDPKHECTIPTTQAIAQGVPVNFGKYIASQVALALQAKLDISDGNDGQLVYQDHSKRMMSRFTIEELDSITHLFIKGAALELN